MAAKTSFDDLIIHSHYKCNTEDPSNELWVHLEGGEVPLWQYDAVVTFTLLSSSFPSVAHANFTKEQILAAISDWGISGIELRFVPESDSRKATFIVRYSKRPNGGTIARAFFPTAEQSDVVIYPLAFSRGQIDYLKNVLAHELGHVYGLRHEFAIEEGDTLQFGPSNSSSVMNYNDPPVIQSSDRIWLQKLYNKNELITFIGTKNFPIHRYTPYS